MENRYKIIIAVLAIFIAFLSVMLVLNQIDEDSKEGEKWPALLDYDPTADIEDPDSKYIEPTYNYTGLGDDCIWVDHPDECYAVVPEPICEDGYVYGDYGCVKE